MAALKKLVERLTKPVEDLDRERLVEFCDTQSGVRRCDELEPRALARVAGEVQSVRIVPRAGAPSLEVAVTDGRGQVTAVFFGRRKLAGLSPGRKLLVEGVVSSQGGRRFMYNPVYELLP
jgi:RecG-like helicase